MKLVVGLGNPGREYENTRHNIGFMVLNKYASKNNLSFSKEKFNGEYLELNNGVEKVILLKPLKYMNLSGEVVRDFVNFYKINVDDILVINDDLDLEIGKFKLKPSGSSGGHNGLKSIELYLGTKSYKRMKIGISNNKMMDTKDYVLGKFSNCEIDILNPIIDIAVNIIDDFISMDFERLMSKYNSKK